MRAAIAGIALVAVTGPAAAEINVSSLRDGPSIIAELHARSGTVAPPFAWAWDVRFANNGAVFITYCKGYAQAEPGCATREERLADGRMEALLTLASTLTSAPSIPNPPVGGSAVWAFVGKVSLPAHPLPEDQARVTAALDALQSFIPAGALADTSSRAKAP